MVIDEGVDLGDLCDGDTDLTNAGDGNDFESTGVDFVFVIANDACGGGVDAVDNFVAVVAPLADCFESALRTIWCIAASASST